MLARSDQHSAAATSEHDALIILDDSGRIQFASEFAEHLFGFESGALVGRPLAVVLPDLPEDFIGLGLPAAQTRRAVPPASGRLLMGQDGNGRRVPLELIAARRDGSAPGARVSLTFRVPPAAAAKPVVDTPGDLLKLASDSAGVGLLIVDRDLTLRFVNRSMTAMLNLGDRDVVGHPAAEVIGPLFDRVMRGPLLEGFAGESSIYDLTLMPADGGAERIVSVTHMRSECAAGECLVVVVFTDITALKQTELALRANRDLLRSVLDGTPDLIFAKDCDGRFVLVNAAMAEILGHPASQILGQQADVFWPVDVARSIEAGDREVIDAGRIVVTESTVAVAGETRTFLSEKRPWRTRSGTIVGLIGVSRDITAQKTAEAEREDLLRRLMRAQEDERLRIARELHDEMGQNLTGLALGLKDLEGAVTDAAGRERLAALRDLTDKIAREIHHTAVRLRPTALTDIGLAGALSAHIETWSSRFGITADAHLLALERVSLDADTATAVFRCVKEALTNVVRHAAARHVSVVATLTPGGMRFVIEDDGVGFEVEASAVRARRGLGLVGMRERLALVGGRLTIESARAAGTTIYIEVKAAR